MNAPASYPTSVGGAVCSIEGPTQSRERVLALAKRAIHSIVMAPHEMALIHVYKGAMWITMEGELEDHSLTNGESMCFHGPGLLVLEALEDETEGSLCFSRP